MIELVAGIGMGLMASPVVGWHISRGVIVRMSHNLTLEAIAADLESRRVARDSGRDTEVPENAGPAGDQSSLFPVQRLGSASEFRRSENRRKLMEQLALRQNSTILEESGSEESDK